MRALYNIFDHIFDLFLTYGKIMYTLIIQSPISGNGQYRTVNPQAFVKPK